MSGETAGTANGSARDDLTPIAGLGEDIACRIDEAGIRTCAELADCSADEIAKRRCAGDQPPEPNVKRQRPEG